jgi:hypothetical protein
MRRNAKPITARPEIVENINALTEANFKLLTRLITWLDGHEKQHTRYRMAMIQRVTRLEAAVSLLLVGQEAQTQGNPPWYQADELEKSARRTEEFIVKLSEQIGMKMIRYIYGKEPAAAAKHDRRGKWWGWEI